MRILFAIGCDEYEDSALIDLQGAVHDASDIYDLLVQNNLGEYHKDESCLLKSPTLTEINETISRILFDLGPIDVLTVFYAGHGAVKDGSYFVCLKDTRADRLSVSGLGLSQLLTWLNEAQVHHTNIIIDSCHSGGLARDIGSFLKPDSVGRFGSPSVSIFATAAADQAAREIDGHGVGTACLLQCLNGEAVVQTSRPSVGLVELGLAAAELLPAEADQTAVCWGLNLFGQSQLARNVSFDDSETKVPPMALSLAEDESSRSVVEKHASRIWAFYLDAENEFDVHRYIKLTKEILNELPDVNTNATLLIRGLAETIASALSDSNDPFEIVELYGASIAMLTPYCESNGEAEALLAELSTTLLQAISGAMEVVHRALEEQEFALLSEHTVLADLYFLPLRILCVFGWIGAGEYIQQQLNSSGVFDRQLAKALVQKILNIYVGSIVAVSDEQTPHLLTFIWSSNALDLDEELEQILGLLYESYHRYGGEVARAELTGPEALQFLKARAQLDYRNAEEAVSRPCDILPALFLGYRKLNIPEVVDESIEDLDHTSFNIFIPETYTDFSQVRIEDGVNHSFQIGYNVWSMDDFESVWGNLAGDMGKMKCLANTGVRIGAICSSMVMPNRSGWFLFV